MGEHWVARADLANGDRIEREFPYTANGNYCLEMDEQYSIECWLMEEADRRGSSVDWYSVDYESEEMASL